MVLIYCVASWELSKGRANVGILSEPPLTDIFSDTNVPEVPLLMGNRYPYWPLRKNILFSGSFSIFKVLSYIKLYVPFIGLASSRVLWRRKWQPTPVFLPGESQGRGSLVGCRLWGRTESDTTQQQQQSMWGFPGGTWEESTCQYKRRKRLGFDPWIGRIPWTRKWPPTPVFLPGKFHGQRSLAGCSPWSHRVGHDLAHAEYIQNKFIYCSTNNTLYLWRLLSYSLFSVSPGQHRYLKYNVVLYQLSGKTENYQGTEEAGRTFTWDCQGGASWGIRDFNWDLKNSFRAIKDVK